MDCVVIFNYAEWVIQYPEFAAVSQPQAQSFFNRATMLCDNTPTSPITDPFQRTIALNAATSHFAALFGPQPGGGQPRGVVGRISSATEGSVSVQTEYRAPDTDTEAFWNQTPYGAAFWAMTLQYRTGFYVPGPVPVYGVGARLPGLAFYRR